MMKTWLLWRQRGALVGAICWLALLGGCAGVPDSIRDAPEQVPGVGAVRKAPDAYVGSKVRWGGTIVTVENRPDESVVELVSRPLADNGRPRETDQSGGRFLARIHGFLDPAVYAAGRELTVVGEIEAIELKQIGNYRYDYPVLKVRGHHLWPVRQPPVPDPFYYPPFYQWPYYDPWAPYPYPYPYPRR